MYPCESCVRYVDPKGDFESLGIVAILLGGSISYKHQELKTVDIAKDWDGIIIVKRKNDIVNLVNNHRSELRQLLDIKDEEYPELSVPYNEKNVLFNNINAVRFVGKTVDGVKKGAKILSVEHFEKILNENSPSQINLLSFKDIRVMNLQDRDDFNFRLIHQASRLDENLVVLHDMDIYITDPCTQHGTRAAIFGVTTDLLMTGSWIYEDSARSGYKISRDLMYKFRKLHTAFLPNKPLTFVFKNHNEFQSWFNRHLEKRFETYEADTNRKKQLVKSLTECTDCVWKNQYFVFGEVQDTVFFKNSIVESPIVKPPVIMHTGKFDMRTVEESSPFSSNSQSGQCKSRDKENKTNFWKQTKFVNEELYGANLVSKFYPRTQSPSMVDLNKQIVIYPFFDGVLLSDIRLEYIKQSLSGNLQNSAPERLILTIELQRSEDLLRAYCSSAKMMDISKKKSSTIDRFFYDRLVNDTRLKQFYRDGIFINNTTHLTLVELKTKKLIINGRNFGNLNQISTRASDILNPVNSERNQLVVCGMGDGHSGNLLVGKEKQPNSTHNFLYIDYEVAGYHSPILDIAKPFFNDVFFDLFYADLFTPADDLISSGTVQVNLTDNSDSAISIDLNLKRTKLSDAIYQIKTRYFLSPFLKFIEENKDLRLGQNWPAVFGHALFCCAVLTRNFSNRPDIFFATLALGVILSSIKSFTVDGIYEDIHNVFTHKQESLD